MQPMQIPATSDEVRQWERDWRASITTQVKDISKNSADTALVVREMQADVKDLMEWRNTQEKRRDSREEKQHEWQRADLAIVLSACTVLIYVLSIVVQHWK